LYICCICEGKDKRISEVTLDINSLPVLTVSSGNSNRAMC
jgi:hypothetical protein